MTINGTPQHAPEDDAELKRVAINKHIHTAQAQLAQNLTNLIRQLPPNLSNAPLEMAAETVGQLVGLMFPVTVGAEFTSDVLHNALERGRQFHALKTDAQKIEVLQAILQPVAASERRVILPGGSA